MKKLLSFYLLILLPVPVIIALYRLNAPVFCLLCIVAYVFIYRPIIAGLRLKELGIIENPVIWKLFIPFYSIKYFHVLFFGIKDTSV